MVGDMSSRWGRQKREGGAADLHGTRHAAGTKLKLIKFAIGQNAKLGSMAAVVFTCTFSAISAGDTCPSSTPIHANRNTRYGGFRMNCVCSSQRENVSASAIEW